MKEFSGSQARQPLHALSESFLKKAGTKSHMFLNPDSSRQASRCGSHGTREALEQVLDEDGQAEQAFPGGVVIHAGSLAGGSGIRIRAFPGNMRGNGAGGDGLTGSGSRGRRAHAA